MNRANTAAAAVLAALACVALPGVAQTVQIERQQLGSGQPGQTGLENAVRVEDGMYHVPQYMPGFPTAATIWPRVINVPCRKNGDVLVCEGYHWLPEFGRAEYLYFVPVLAASAPGG